ncbi:unnamed protein product [Ectocarpus sp. 12 AP-2014]
MSAATADTMAAPMVGARNRTPGRMDAQGLPRPTRVVPLHRRQGSVPTRARARGARAGE